MNPDVYDENAERTVIGCAIAHPMPAALVLDRLTADDFWHPGHRRLFEVLPDLADVPYTWDDSARIDAAARLAAIDSRDVTELVRTRLVWSDENGWCAGRVLEAATRRRAMFVLEAAYRQIRDGADLGQVLEEVQAVIPKGLAV